MDTLVPVLESERLRLRGHKAADLEAMTAMWSDPRVTEFIGGKPANRAEVWRRMLSYVGHWSLMGFGAWLVEEKATGLYVGDVTLANWERGMVFPNSEKPEAGWALLPAMQGKGYAREALQCALSWADKQPNFDITTCAVNPQNVRSLAMAKQLGYFEVDRTNIHGETLVLMNRLAGG